MQNTPGSLYRARLLTMKLSIPTGEMQKETHTLPPPNTQAAEHRAKIPAQARHSAFSRRLTRRHPCPLQTRPGRCSAPPGRDLRWRAYRNRRVEPSRRHRRCERNFRCERSLPEEKRAGRSEHEEPDELWRCRTAMCCIIYISWYHIIARTVPSYIILYIYLT